MNNQIIKTQNCHIRNSKKDSNHVYCGRGKGKNHDPWNCKPGESGYWGNPFAVGKKCDLCGTVHKNGGDTLLCYRDYLETRLAGDKIFREEFFKLKGKTLVCFCKPNPCHTDIMILLLENSKLTDFGG